MACALPRLRPEASGLRGAAGLHGSASSSAVATGAGAVHPGQADDVGVPVRIKRRAARLRARGAASEPNLRMLPQLLPEIRVKRTAENLGRTCTWLGKGARSGGDPVIAKDNRREWYPGYGEVRRPSCSPTDKMVVRHGQRQELAALAARLPTVPTFQDAVVLKVSNLGDKARGGTGQELTLQPQRVDREELSERKPVRIAERQQRLEMEAWARSSAAHHEWVTGLLLSAQQRRATNTRLAPVLEASAAATAIIDREREKQAAIPASSSTARPVPALPPWMSEPPCRLPAVMGGATSVAGPAQGRGVRGGLVDKLFLPVGLTASTLHTGCDDCVLDVQERLKKCFPQGDGPAAAQEQMQSQRQDTLPKGYFAERQASCSTRAQNVWDRMSSIGEIVRDDLVAAVQLLGHVRPNEDWIQEAVVEAQGVEDQSNPFPIPESSADGEDGNASADASTGAQQAVQHSATWTRSYLDHTEFLAFAVAYESRHFGRIRKAFEQMGPNAAGLVSLDNVQATMEKLSDMSPMPGALHELVCEAIAGGIAEFCSCGEEFAFEILFCGKCGEKRPELLPEQMVAAHHGDHPESINLNIFAHVCDLCEPRAGLTHWGFTSLRALFQRCGKAGSVDAEGVKSVLALDHSNVIHDTKADKALVEELVITRDRLGFLDFLCEMRTARAPGVKQAREVFERFPSQQRALFERDRSQGFEMLSVLFANLGFHTASPDILQEIWEAEGMSSRISFDDFWRLLQRFNKQCGLSSHTISNIRSIFQEFDEDKSGGISVSELRYVVRRMGYPATFERVQELQEEFDADGSGELEFDEVVRLIARYRECEVVSAQSAFRRLAAKKGKRVQELKEEFDSDGSSQLECDEEVKPGEAVTESGKLRGQYLRDDTVSTENQVLGCESKMVSIAVTDIKMAIQMIGYLPSKEQEATLLSSVDAGVSEVGIWKVMSLVEEFRVLAREEFQRNHGFTKMQLDGLREKFLNYDSEDLGFIKHSQVASLLTDLFADAAHSQESRLQLEELLKISGAGQKGNLDFPGFIRLMRVYQDRQDYTRLQQETETMESLKFSRFERIELRQVFGMFDADHSGDIDADELAVMVSIIVPGVTGERLKEVKDMLNEVDTNGNRALGFIEFLKIIRMLQDRNWQGFNQKAEEAAALTDGGALAGGGRRGSRRTSQTAKF